MQEIYSDRQIFVCVKPPRVLSTDEPGGMPELIRAHLGDTHANVRTVHRLDMVVSGLMVYARSAAAAGDLSREIREGSFQKHYLAVVRGVPEEPKGELCDLLQRNKAERKTYVVTTPGKDAQEAALRYGTLESVETETGPLSLVRIELITGRTHQIRCQFASRGLPLVGDRKYGSPEETGEIALWSHSLRFHHPKTGEELAFTLLPPREAPWTAFEYCRG